MIIVLLWYARWYKDKTEKGIMIRLIVFCSYKSALFKNTIIKIIAEEKKRTNMINHSEKGRNVSF